MNKLGKTAQELVSQVQSGIKSSLLDQSNLFESLHLRYFGPIDGHDIDHLVSVLDDLKHIPGPKLLHVLTVKGKGYGPAEKDQTKWHAPGLFDKVTGVIQKKIYDTPQPPKYQDVFGNTLVELAEAKPTHRGRNTRYAVGFVDEHHDEGHANAGVRCGHCRTTRRYVLGGYGYAGRSCILQYLLDIHAAGL